MELANKVAAIAKRTLPVSGVFDEASAAAVLMARLQPGAAVHSFHACAMDICLRTTPLTATAAHCCCPAPAAADPRDRRVQVEERGGCDCGQAGGAEQSQNQGRAARAAHTEGAAGQWQGEMVVHCFLLAQTVLVDAWQAVDAWQGLLQPPCFCAAARCCAAAGQHMAS